VFSFSQQRIGQFQAFGFVVRGLLDDGETVALSGQATAAPGEAFGGIGTDADPEATGGILGQGDPR
jgi:hypothetical protein